MRTVQPGPAVPAAVGLIAVVVLLGVLDATTGLGPAGWTAGTVTGLVLAGLLARSLARDGAAPFGPADGVTLLRAVLAAGVTALVADGFTRPVPVAVLVGLAAVGLVLDGVDGRVARRTGSGSPRGARFDMEVDAYLILVLSVHVAAGFGAWVLLIGLARYLRLAAGYASRRLAGEAPARFWNKVVAVVQGVALTVVTAGVLPATVAVVVLVAALALLTESFGREIGWLWRHGAPRPAERAGSARAGPRECWESARRPSTPVDHPARAARVEYVRRAG